jgi:choline dehydrogenase-like flavoprotein
MEHYDVIIIGTGAGGGTLAHKLAPSGQKILLLERGGYLPREPENWSGREVFRKERYLDDELWHDKDGAPYKPHQQYFVGGNTKFYGAILFRLRERAFDEVGHYGGISSAWPISYADLEPYYAEAEKLYSFTARRARTRPNRGARAHSRSPRCRTSRGSSSSPTTSSAPPTTSFTFRSASTSTSQTPRPAGACAATASTGSPAWPTERQTPTCDACARRSSTPTSS